MRETVLLNRKGLRFHEGASTPKVRGEHRMRSARVDESFVDEQRVGVSAHEFVDEEDQARHLIGVEREKRIVPRDDLRLRDEQLARRRETTCRLSARQATAQSLDRAHFELADAFSRDTEALAELLQSRNR